MEASHAWAWAGSQLDFQQARALLDRHPLVVHGLSASCVRNHESAPNPKYVHYSCLPHNWQGRSDSNYKYKYLPPPCCVYSIAKPWESSYVQSTTKPFLMVIGFSHSINMQLYVCSKTAIIHVPQFPRERTVILPRTSPCLPDYHRYFLTCTLLNLSDRYLLIRLPLHACRPACLAPLPTACFLAVFTCIYMYWPSVPVTTVYGFSRSTVSSIVSDVSITVVEPIPSIVEVSTPCAANASCSCAIIPSISRSPASNSITPAPFCIDSDNRAARLE